MGILDQVSQATNLPKAKVLKLALGFLVLFVVFGVGQGIISNLIGVAYPIFMSFHALESKGTEDDDKQWLTYWVVYGLFALTDQCAGFILHFIPFYYVLKVAVLIWLFHPSTQGATWVYNEYIQPYAKDIDELRQSVSDGIDNSVRNARKAAGLQ